MESLRQCTGVLLVCFSRRASVLGQDTWGENYSRRRLCLYIFSLYEFGQVSTFMSFSNWVSISNNPAVVARWFGSVGFSICSIVGHSVFL